MLFTTENGKTVYLTVKGKMVYKNGNVYDGEWKHGIHYCKGKMVYKNGDVFDGEWELKGTGILTFKDNAKNYKIFKGEFNYGLPKVGTMQYTTISGNYNGEWKNGVFVKSLVGTIHKNIAKGVSILRNTFKKGGKRILHRKHKTIKTTKK